MAATAPHPLFSFFFIVSYFSPTYLRTQIFKTLKRGAYVHGMAGVPRERPNDYHTNCRSERNGTAPSNASSTHLPSSSTHGGLNLSAYTNQAWQKAPCIKAFIHGAIKSWGVESGNEATSPCMRWACCCYYYHTMCLWYV